jgi:hypothetical protein
MFDAGNAGIKNDERIHINGLYLVILSIPNFKYLSKHTNCMYCKFVKLFHLVSPKKEMRDWFRLIGNMRSKNHKIKHRVFRYLKKCEL